MHLNNPGPGRRVQGLKVLLGMDSRMPKETPTEEQQQTEASLRVFGEWASPQLSDARLLRRIQQILDATTDAILFLDRAYNVTFLNRRAKELLAQAEM